MPLLYIPLTIFRSHEFLYPYFRQIVSACWPYVVAFTLHSQYIPFPGHIPFSFPLSFSSSSWSPVDALTLYSIFRSHSAFLSSFLLAILYIPNIFRFPVTFLFPLVVPLLIFSLNSFWFCSFGHLFLPNSQYLSFSGHFPFSFPLSFSSSSTHIFVK